VAEWEPVIDERLRPEFQRAGCRDFAALRGRRCRWRWAVMGPDEEVVCSSVLLPDEAAPPWPYPPVAPLVEDGYDAHRDSAVARLRGRGGEACEGATCLGISMVTAHDHAGRGSGRAVRVASGRHRGRRLARLHLPSRLRSACFDAVVKGQGEVTFREMVARYAKGERDMEGIAGCFFKRGHAMVAGPPRGYTDINALPRRPFHLVDFEGYARKCGGLRWILYCTSHGCPWDCSYCSNASVYGRTWKPLEADTSVGEMAELVRRYRLEVVDHRRQLPRAATARWPSRRGCSSTRRRSRTTCDAHRPDGPPQRRRAGPAGPQRPAPHLLRPGVGLGEGDALVNKRLDLRRPTARPSAARVGIRPSFNPHLRPAGRGGGGPARHHGGGRPHRPRQPRGRLFTNIFSPYPGSPIWPLAVERRARAADAGGVGGVLPQGAGAALAAGRAHARIQRIRDYIRIGYSSRQMVVAPPRGSGRVAAHAAAPARWRLRTLLTQFPLDLWALRTWRAVRRGRPRR
jgi:hypothetical protein